MSVRGNRDVAAERLGADSCRAAADGEGEALGVARADAVLARLERDRKLAVHAAAPRLDGELSAGVALHVEPNVTGVRGEVIAPGRIDRTVEGDVAARGLGADELGGDAAKLDVAADGADFDVAAEVDDLHIAARRADLDVSGDAVGFDTARQGVDVESVRDVFDIDVTTLCVGFDFTARPVDGNVTGHRADQHAYAVGNAHLEPRVA